MSGPVRATLGEGGALLELVLDRPKGNVLDLETIAALRAELARARELRGLRAALLSGSGAHFSFGASVEEHRPERVGAMLPAFHALCQELLAGDLVVLAAVRGQCLGGGLELVLCCQRAFAAPDARLGQPEVRLGVVAPVASLLLPLRCGQALADDLLLTGRSVSGSEAALLGLVDELAEDPLEAARAWARRHLLPLSAAALRHAARAARHVQRQVVAQSLPALERAYLEELMATHDAREGIAAFLGKREPQWTHA